MIAKKVVWMTVLWLTHRGGLHNRVHATAEALRYGLDGIRWIGERGLTYDLAE
jgi:hypothetical protein